MKATVPKQRSSEYKSNIEYALKKKAKRQLRKAYQYLENNWEWAQEKLSISNPWTSIKVHQLIVSTTFEVDRAPIFDKALKISQFELERYLKNDALLCIDESNVSRRTARKLAGGFYPEGVPLSGDRLWQLIEENSLWAFLDEQLAHTNIDSYMPTFAPEQIYFI